MTTPVVNLDRLEVEQDTIGDSRFGGKYFTGIAYEEHAATGTVIAIIGYSHGKRHGAIREWNRAGAPVDEEYMRNGGSHGPFRKWHRNGRLAESLCIDARVLIRLKSWDESGKLVKDYTLPPGAPEWAKIEEEHKRKPDPVIDIDLTTLTFFERPVGWGRNESDLPPPPPRPSLELCRALESQALAKR